jgi:hypothetical protein
MPLYHHIIFSAKISLIYNFYEKPERKAGYHGSSYQQKYHILTKSKKHFSKIDGKLLIKVKRFHQNFQPERTGKSSKKESRNTSLQTKYQSTGVNYAFKITSGF